MILVTFYPDRPPDVRIVRHRRLTEKEKEKEEKEDKREANA